MPVKDWMTRLPLLAGLVVAAALASACGGGDEAPPPTGTAPTTPTASHPATTRTPAATVTRTPQPAAPTSVPPTATPTIPPSVALPVRPQHLSQYAGTIADYLTAAGAPASCPDDLLDLWAIPISPGARCVLADTDADGQDELVLVLATEVQQDTPVTLAILDQSAGSWGVAFQPPITDGGGAFLVSMADSSLDDVLMAAYDLNAAPGAEVVYRLDTCGAHTCFTTVEVVGWNGSAYVDLTADEIGISFADIALEDRDGDGTIEIIMHGGAIGSWGAGPTRTRTEVYAWNGGQYALSEVTEDPSDYLYHNVMDADDALIGGDAALALDLYARALSDRSLVEWKENERAEMVPYIHFRMALAHVALGGSTAEAAQSLDDAVEANPGSLHGEIARAFRDAWTPMGDATAGCQAADSYVQANLEAFEEFWYFGYGNPEFDPDRLCPF